eukprot:TRINITY_DN31585_c0_g1_i1.p1 TRINITY_DN31585_c0_g1~~TRINITY_DN31585_c0_g1_i1.p1  ORF type:complete len:554 (-),score=147.92 TRINITY_DN31585_c0_g1_i1:24-1685(-)
MDEKYQRIKVLGKGSFGKAYLVRNTETDTKCVVKQMETGMMGQKERSEAVKEALLLKRMDHPNIVRFQEVFMTRKGRLCIVMDYADGGDIHMEIKRQEGCLLAEPKVVEWFVQVCFALKHVHSRKVLHRDLKTQNIFLMASGQIKLGDFGIARVLDATKDYAKTMVGTPYYLSPEIIEDKPYNFKSDIWSCGVVLYEMVTLKHPFDADSLVILAGKILRDKYPDPDPMYSQDLKTLIRSMLCKDASQRPNIVAILQEFFLQGAMYEANRKYELGIDLSEFVTEVPARPSLAERRRREVEAAAQESSAAATSSEAAPAPLAPPASEPAPAPAAAVVRAAEDGDVVLTGTVPQQQRPPALGFTGAVQQQWRPERAPTSPCSTATGQDPEEDYEEEFEDYSGSEDGDREPPSDLQRSVANLRLGPDQGAGGGGSHPSRLGGIAEDADGSPTAAVASSAAAGGMVSAQVGGTGAATGIAAKAASLRSYLCSQMPTDDFQRAYELVRGASREGAAPAPAEELQARVADVIGSDKVPELFTLFQLLCFLEDVASNGGSP